MNPNSKIKELKKRANTKNIDFDLTTEWLHKKLQQTHCAITGLKFKVYRRKRHPFAPSIDRIDNNKGYTKDNCQLVIWAYNTAKAEFTDNDIYKMAKAYLTNKK